MRTTIVKAHKRKGRKVRSHVRKNHYRVLTTAFDAQENEIVDYSATNSQADSSNVTKSLDNNSLRTKKLKPRRIVNY